jgi:uncharacterized membrane protein YqiK
LNKILKETQMNGTDFGQFLLGLIAAAIVIAIGIWLLHWLYLRSSKERAFVRTGLGGEKVVLGGGAFVLPIVHDVISVNMNTLRLEVSRGSDNALITKDRLRVDVVAEFYVRVQATKESVAAAAQTLGLRTLEPEKLKELIEGKFVDALRTVAATMSMEDQTQMEFFNPNNAFDAEGLTRLTEQIEQRKKERNDIEQDTLLAIRNKNLQVEKQQLDIDRESEFARIDQNRQVEGARVRQRAELAQERALQDQESETSQITAKQAIEAARIRSDQTIEQERIRKEQNLQTTELERRTSLDLAEQRRTIAIAEQSREQSEAQAAADAARALAVAAEEGVYTAREVAVAERKKAIDLIAASQAGEKEALRLQLAVNAERDAASVRGEAIRAQASAEAEADQIRSDATKLRATVEADAARQMNEAHNVLSPESRNSLFRSKLLDKMEGIIRESVRPMENIDGIKIISVNGLGGGNGQGGADGSGAPGSLPEQMVSSALRFRAQAPLVDNLLKEIGIDGSSIENATKSLMGTPGAVAGE